MDPIWIPWIKGSWFDDPNPGSSAAGEVAAMPPGTKDVGKEATKSG